MFDLLGIGANSIDFVYRLPAYPEPGGLRSKLRIQNYERSPGGQTATMLAACAALGLSAAYVGTISSDENGSMVRGALERCGVDVSRAVLRDAPNPFAVVLVAEADGGGGNAERIVLWDRDPGMRLTPDDLPREIGGLARLVHVDDVDIDAAIAAARAGREAGIPVTSDIELAAPRTPDLVDAVSVPIFAEHVPQVLTGEPDLEAALRAIRRRHAGLLCATRGRSGAALLAGDRFIEQGAFAVDAVDTTGAGDVFRAGFACALLRGDSPAGILRFACAAAAVSCTRRGAIASVPTPAEVSRLLR
ncbi:MAG TPA: carbohydrate kinase family protein [Vicinamibacterales bacterium]